MSSHPACQLQLWQSHKIKEKCCFFFFFPLSTQYHCGRLRSLWLFCFLEHTVPLWKVKVSPACDPPRISWGDTAVAGFDSEARGFPGFGVSVLRAIEGTQTEAWGVLRGPPIGLTGCWGPMLGSK